MTAYVDTFRKILLQPDGVTLTADAVNDTLTITRGNGIAFNPNATNDSFEIDVDYELFVPVGTTELRLNDVNSNYSGITLTAGSNVSIGRNSSNEIIITSTVGGTSKSISNASQTSPVVITTTNVHVFTEGIAVTITDVVGMTQLNGNEYYMDILTSNTFALYEDSNLTTPLDGTGFSSYVSGGVATAEYSAPQALSQLIDVDLTSTPPVNGTYLQYNGSLWVAGTTLNGNFVGSVFADDSTLLVDGVNGSIPWNVVNGTPTTLSGYGITDAATSAQGTLADTAVQPADLSPYAQLSSATFTGLVTLQQTTEKLNTITGATGTVVHNLNNGAVFNHTSLAADFTANFTNVPTTDDRTTSVVLILNQGGTAYIPTALEIDGAAQTINWQSAVTPSGNANQIDTVSFTLIRTGAAWTVIGSLATYG